MDSTVYNSLKRLRIDDTEEDRQSKRPSMESWSSSHRPTAGGGPFMNTLRAAHNNGAARNSHDHGVFDNVFGSFMVSTKTNTQYNAMNQVLHGIHNNRYSNTQRQEACSGGTDDSQPMEDVSFYLAANTILREAFLQRHRHPDDLSS
ncbi:predicted protein [Lichtheimia corymbifera JMRC:FSU:9682]|uniref:Uncharacterized protein n=1 Tax=Lichtheimia corymbifera JMRC:FSU:9682 TaxID=1263082 RepID=A0A068SDK3_9FUNG|nr:predicted protein [Lichtheimia corymbifera JMRC:FSU:9682]